MGKEEKVIAVIWDIRRQLWERHNTEEKIRIVLEGLRSEEKKRYITDKPTSEFSPTRSFCQAA